VSDGGEKRERERESCCCRESLPHKLRPADWPGGRGYLSPASPPFLPLILQLMLRKQPNSIIIAYNKNIHLSV
jgi:hypothetical protein